MPRFPLRALVPGLASRGPGDPDLRDPADLAPAPPVVLVRPSPPVADAVSGADRRAHYPSPSGMAPDVEASLRAKAARAPIPWPAAPPGPAWPPPEWQQPMVVQAQQWPPPQWMPPPRMPIVVAQVEKPKK